MILIALGANLPSRFGDPPATLGAACAALVRRGVAVVARSRLYRTAPVPASDQPDYYNAVVAAETAQTPAPLLATLHAVEEAFGRVRTIVKAPRLLDLDLLAYDDVVTDGNLVLPHPRLQDRAFVLHPLRDVAPGWTHPVTGRAIDALIDALPPQGIEEAGMLE